VETYCIAVQATDDNMALVHCMLDAYGYKHALRICNSYYFYQCSNGYMNMPQCYITCTLPVVEN